MTFNNDYAGKLDVKFEVFIFVSLILVSICLSILIVYYSFQRRKAPGAIYLAIMQITGIIWSVGYIVEILGTTLAEKMLGVKIQYFCGLEFTPVFWMFSILNFSSLAKKPNKYHLVAVMIIPFITMALALFMEQHSFFYVNPHLVESGPFLLIEKDWGIWFYVNVLYSYMLNVFASVLLIKSILKKQLIFRKQTAFWLLATFLPWITNVFYVLGMHSFMRLDFTNAAFSISAGFFGIAINKYGLFKLIPAAHEFVIESMPNGLIVLDNAEKIVDANPASRKIFGNPNLIGITREELLRGIKIHWDIDQSKESEIFVIEIHNCIYEMVITDLFDASKAKTGMILNFYDITDRIKTEKALNESNATKDKFFSIIAHDLRNPFFGILGLAELLANPEEDISSAEQKEMLNEIRDLSRNTYKMLENLLDWSRSQTGRLEYNPEKIEMRECIIENISQLKNSAEIKMISLSYEIAQTCTIFADRNMINTVIRNLLSNAIKFTQKSGSIKIFSSVNNSKVEVSIEDTGIGMEEKVLREVFNLDKTSKSVGTSGEKGTGLGLVLCKEFVEKNNGLIWANSTPGKGSIFTFSLPSLS